MMDFFYIFQYQLASAQEHTDLPFSPLSSVKMTKVNINIEDQFSSDDAENITEFTNLHVDLTQEKVLFKKMLQQIVKSINEMMINFVNISLICEDVRLFTEVIPKECKRREIAVPYVLQNFLDIKQIVRIQYQCPYKKIDEIVQFLKICTIKEAQNKSQSELLERILKKLHKDKLLQSTTQRFIHRCQKLIQEVQKQQSIKSKYYKIIGLPFKSFPAEIMQILAPEVPQSSKQICFIYENERFSGRAMIKIPQDYESFFIRKNRMYIGPRYIELEASTEEEFQKAKIRLEHRSTERSLNKDPRDYRQNQREYYNIGHGSRRQRSRSPIDQRRSRQKHGGFRSDPRDEHRSSHFDHDYSGRKQGEYGIKVRGLPFAFSQWDVENVFNAYNIIGGSVKLGIKPGTILKNGEAVILMRNYNDAQKALDMQGFRCMGRYLEVRVIGKEDYLRYK